MELTHAQAWNLSMHKRLPFFLKSTVMESEDAKIQRLSFGWIEFLPYTHFSTFFSLTLTLIRNAHTHAHRDKNNPTSKMTARTKFSIDWAHAGETESEETNPVKVLCGYCLTAFFQESTHLRLHSSIICNSSESTRTSCLAKLDLSRRASSVRCISTTIWKLYLNI